MCTKTHPSRGPPTSNSLGANTCFVGVIVYLIQLGCDLSIHGVRSRPCCTYVAFAISNRRNVAHVGVMLLHMRRKHTTAIEWRVEVVACSRAHRVLQTLPPQLAQKCQDNNLYARPRDFYEKCNAFMANARVPYLGCASNETIHMHIHLFGNELAWRIFRVTNSALFVASSGTDIPKIC